MSTEPIMPASVPSNDLFGDTFGAIGLIGPAFRCDEAWQGRAGRLIAEAARTINAALAEDTAA